MSLCHCAWHLVTFFTVRPGNCLVKDRRSRCCQRYSNRWWRKICSIATLSTIKHIRCHLGSAPSPAIRTRRTTDGELWQGYVWLPLKQNLHFMPWKLADWRRIISSVIRRFAIIHATFIQFLSFSYCLYVSLIHFVNFHAIVAQYKFNLEFLFLHRDRWNSFSLAHCRPPICSDMNVHIWWNSYTEGRPIAEQTIAQNRLHTCIQRSEFEIAIPALERPKTFKTMENIWLHYIWKITRSSVRPFLWPRSKERGGLETSPLYNFLMKFVRFFSRVSSLPHRQLVPSPSQRFHLGMHTEALISGSLPPRHGASSGCEWRNGLLYGG